MLSEGVARFEDMHFRKAAHVVRWAVAVAADMLAGLNADLAVDGPVMRVVGVVFCLAEHIVSLVRW